MFDKIEFSFKANPFHLKANPLFVFIPGALMVIGLIWGTSAAVSEEGGNNWIPVVSNHVETATVIISTPTPTPVAVLTEGPPTPETTTTTTPTTTLIPLVTPTPDIPISVSVVVEPISPPVIVEPTDLAPLVDAILEAALGDITINITIEGIDGTSEMFECDTRGQGCEEPPFGNN